MAAGMDYKAVPEYHPIQEQKPNLERQNNDQQLVILLTQIKKILDDINTRLNAGGL